MDEGLWRAPPRRRTESRAPRRRGRLLAAALLVAAGASAAAAALLLPGGPHGRYGSVRLHPCPLADGLSGLCGRVSVPLDPGDAGGRKIGLRVAVLPATRHREGAAFWLEGGPGGAASQSALAASTLLGPVERTRDLVLLDQRGTGGSAAASCPAPDGRLAAWLRRCLAAHPGARFLTSAAAADDVDAVRRALGYGRVDLVGASYGATLAQLVAERHPGAVRSLVLDAATPLGVPVYAREPATAARALAGVVAECTAVAACRRAYPHLAAEARAGLRGGPGVSRAAAAATVEALLRTADGQAVVPYDLDRAARGNVKPLGEDFKTYVGTGIDRRLRLLMAWEIQCREPWARLGPAGSGFLAPAVTARNALLRDGCAALPQAHVPAEPAGPVDRPALVLVGSTDPQSAPYAARWKRLLPAARLVVVAGGAHGVSDVGCVPRLVVRFLERGSADGLDTRCARRAPPPAFQLR